MAKDKMIALVVTRAFAIGGEIKTPGAPVTVKEQIARNLLHRGRAVLATSDDTGDEPDQDLSKWKVPALKSRAADLEIDGAANMAKADLIAAIEAAEAE